MNATILSIKMAPTIWRIRAVTPNLVWCFVFCDCWVIVADFLLNIFWEIIINTQVFLERQRVCRTLIWFKCLILQIGATLYSYFFLFCSRKLTHFVTFWAAIIGEKKIFYKLMYLYSFCMLALKTRYSIRTQLRVI